ncbi:MAG: hypothetical protein R3Y04_00115 [Rikenellaceae bacterium]
MVSGNAYNTKHLDTEQLIPALCHKVYINYSMKKIILIFCVSKKLDTPHPAEELYVSPLFKKALAYAKSLNLDRIFILSAEHGLLPLDRVIAPYNKTLNKIGVNDRRLWAQGVLNDLREECDLDNDHFTVLAGMKYREFIFAKLKHCDVPMERMSIGRQLSFLTPKN